MKIEINEVIKVSNIAFMADGYIEIYGNGFTVSIPATVQMKRIMDSKDLSDKAKGFAIAEILKELIPSLQVEL